ncbi:MAG: NADH-quinone oxidoreductase subunit N [Candidatus Obscuribacterales bacterium]
MNSLESYITGVSLIAPEIIVVVAILLTSVWDLFLPSKKAVTPWLGLVSLAISFFLFTGQLNLNEKAFGGLYTVDSLTAIFGLIAAAVGFIVILMTMGYEHHFKSNRAEFYAILLTAVVAVMFLAGSTDLIMLFVSLETLSICCVILSGFSKGDVRSGEASLKYLLSTAAATATLLYALSFIYGITGGTSFEILGEKLQMMAVGSGTLLKMLILALVLSAIGFKLSIVPFHMWTPDVYEGAPTPVTAFLSIGSKAGGFVVAMRFLIEVLGSAFTDWVFLVSFLAMASMIAGNLIALAQTSFKRMLAYSSIAHVGYMLIGLVAFSTEGLQSMLFYIVVYGLMNLGAFAGAILFSNETGSDRIEDYAGLIRKRPIQTILMSVCLLNLAGLPVPPAGFFAKIFIFKAGLGLTDMSAALNNLPAAATQHYAMAQLPIGWMLVAVALITSIPAIYYYTRVVIMMVVPEPSKVVASLKDRPAFVGSPQEGPWAALLTCTVAVLLAGTVLVSPIMDISKTAASSISPEKRREIGFNPFVGL